MRWMASRLAALACAAALLAPRADARDWWPVKIYDMESGKPVVQEYTPLAKAEKPWNICVLFPHMKDTFWVAVDYGVVEEAKRLGVNMTLYQAGGYENLPQQLSQFDDCLASNFDAIVVGAISEAGLQRKIAEATRGGKPVISTVNPVAKAATTAKMYVDFAAMGAQTGKYLASSLGGKEAQVVAFPGPAGSGWAEQFVAGFKDAIKPDANIKLLGEKFGDSGVSVQLGLIQNALQAYPGMNVIWGSAPTAEAAIGAVAQAGRKDISIISSYENQALLDALNKGEILGFATQYPVLEGRIAIDTAVRILEHKPYMRYTQPIPSMIDKEDLSSIDMSLVLAPASFSAEYQVHAAQ